MIEIMPDDVVDYILAQTKTQRTLRQGTNLFHQGDPVRAIYVVEDGLVELTRHQSDGTSIILQRATGRTVLAEASLYSENYHCDGVVTLPARVFEWPKTAFIKRLQDDENFSKLWARHLAHEVQSARYRSEILSRRTVAERLDGWLIWQGNTPPQKGHWKSVAAQIGVSPEALYRELAKRR